MRGEDIPKYNPNATDSSQEEKQALPSLKQKTPLKQKKNFFMLEPEDMQVKDQILTARETKTGFILERKQEKAPSNLREYNRL